ncbi:serine protease [Pleionea sp. CnH1-48]|uniref:trypsin-like serine peptidase n=1 Tax=Pleionea sp. CnH1-48 TaxID=2954494 RepID=UPI002097467C|nr:hypothetical protein [Pleionea sp. CnH1-48]MCO7223854.1 hypothetical protein [Pleionea sp. CnH1-48]
MGTNYSLSQAWRFNPSQWARQSGLLVAAVLCQFVAVEATAKEEMVRTSFGEVVVKHNQDRGKGVLSQNSAINPFATRAQRAAIEALSWNESSPAPVGTKQLEAPTMNLPNGDSMGGQPEADANQRAQIEFADAWAFIEEQDRIAAKNQQSPIDALDGTHGIFTRYAGNLYSQMWKYAPFNKIGKLYFKTPSGGSSYCTANVISSTGHIATAAHCIYTRGQGFNNSFSFVPADRYGAAPYGSFGWSSATVLNDWINVGDRKSDLGIIKLANNASGIPVTSYVGWLGKSWNYGYTQHMHSFGYASNLSTQYTNICAAQSFYSGTEGTNVLVKGCDMTYGSSGGGWLRNFLPYSHGGNYVNGVVSGPHIGGFGNTYVGPRFSSYNIVALCNVQGC